MSVKIPTEPGRLTGQDLTGYTLRNLDVGFERTEGE